jgi:hypothetical protein
MSSAGGVIQELGLVWRKRVLHLQPRDCLVSQIMIENIVGLSEIRFDGCRVLVKRRMPLIAVAAKEAVEVLKPRPTGYRSNGPAWLDIQSGTLCALPNQAVL